MSSKRCLTAAVLLAALFAGRGPAAPSDCNRNAVRDAEDIASGASHDCNANGIPDECDVRLFEPGGPAPLVLPPGDAVRGFALADLNGDGSADAAALMGEGVEQSGSVAIFVSAGEAGLWERGDSYAESVAPSILLPADIEGDGDADLFVLHPRAEGRPESIHTLLNSGGARFARGSTLSWEGTLTGTAAADLDADGDVDLVGLQVLLVERLLLLHVNDGAGEFTRRAVRALPVDSTTLAIADLNADGKNDVLAFRWRNVEQEGSASAYLNQGGDFAEPRVSVVEGPFPLAVADLDGDGFPDLVMRVAKVRERLSLLLGAGDGGFPAARSLSAGTVPESIETLDLDGDRDQDLAAWGARGNGGSLFTLGNQGAGEFSAPLLVASLGAPPSAGDVDGDGDLDLVAESDLRVLENTGRGTFRTAAGHATGLFPADLAAGDLDADGAPDLASANVQSRSVSVLRGDGAGGFVHAERALEFAPVAIAMADVDRDGLLDLALAGDSSFVWLQNGGGAAFTQDADRVRVGSGPLVLAAADVDGDGDQDLVTANELGNVSVFVSGGDGRLSAPRNFSVSGSPADMAAADLDGDRDVDVALTLPAADSIAFLWNRGDGSFLEGTPLAAAERRFRRVLAADADRDGRVDLLAWGVNGVGIYRSLGNGVFTPHLEAPSLEALRPCGSAAAVDLDRDGDPDWVFPGDRTRVLRNTVGSFESVEVQTCPVPCTGSDCRGTLLRNPVAVEDFDADGDGDLAVPCGDAVCLLLGRLAEASSDLDQDRVPDECQRPREEPFRRGDANGDGAASLTDAIVILNRLFAGGAALACPRAADADDDGSVSLTDAVRVLAFLFRGDGAPAPPFPVCGTDPTPDALGDCRYPQGQCGP